MDETEIAVDIDQFIQNYPVRSDPRFSYKLARLKEFADLKLPVTEELPTEPGIPLLHQEIAKRYFSPHTDYKSSIIWHSLGAGKTCTSGLVIEYHKFLKSQGGPKALVLVKNEGMIKNYEDKIANECTKEVYHGRLTGDESPELRAQRIRKELSKVYEIRTWGTFLAELRKRRKKEWIIRNYSNRIIIIDEAHHLNVSQFSAKKGEKLLYKEMKDFLHTVQDCRVLLLTGTPIWDTTSEIASLLNLILPPTDQLPTGGKFTKKYFRRGKLRKDTLPDLKEKLRGRISFLRTSLTPRIDIGFSSPWLKHIKVFPDGMSEFQYQNLVRIGQEEEKRRRTKKGKEKVDPIKIGTLTIGAWKKEKGVGIRQGEREASIMIYPDIKLEGRSYTIGEKGLWGFEAFKKYAGALSRYSAGASIGKEYRLLPKMVKRADRNPNKQRLNEIFVGLIRRQENGKLVGLREYSTKIASIFENILAHPKQLFYIYTGDFAEISGGGSVQIASLLELLQKEGKQIFFRALNASRISTPSAKGTRRFVVITGSAEGTITSDAEIKKVLKEFNRPENRHGAHCQVIIGSQKLAEGIDLRNIRQVHIVAPHWNLPSIHQAIGRAFRLGSHKDLPPEERNVTVYHHAAVKVGDHHKDQGFPKGVGFSDEVTTDIDIYRLIEKKEIRNAEMYRLMKKMAWDCPLNYRRNVLTSEIPESRDCDYRECNYICDGFPPTSKESPVWEYDIPPKDIQRTNYDLFYASEEKEALKREIILLFRSYFRLSLSSIIKLLDLKETSGILLLQVLDEMIEDRTGIRNRYGFDCYLKEKGDFYFLDTQVDPVFAYQTAMYTEYPLITGRTDLTQLVDISQLDQDQKTICKFASTGKAKYYTSLNDVSRILLLEWGAVMKELSKRKKKTLTPNEKRVLKVLKWDINDKIHKVFDGNLVHTLRGDLRVYDFDYEGWYSISVEEARLYLKDLQDVKERKRKLEFQKRWKDNPYGFVGILDHRNGEFSIITRETVGKKGKPSERSTIPTGKKCTSYLKPDLIWFFLKLNEYPPASPKPKKMNKNTLINGIKSTKEYEKYKELFPDSPLKSLPRERLNQIYTLFTLKNPELCKRLKEWFQRPENEKFLEHRY